MADAERALDLRVIQLEAERVNAELFAIRLDAQYQIGNTVFVVSHAANIDLAFQQQVFQAGKVGRLARSRFRLRRGRLAQQFVEVQLIGSQIKLDIGLAETCHIDIPVELRRVNVKVEIAEHVLLLHVNVGFEGESALHGTIRQRRVPDIQIARQLGQVEHHGFQIGTERGRKFACLLYTSPSPRDGL